MHYLTSRDLPTLVAWLLQNNPRRRRQSFVTGEFQKAAWRGHGDIPY